MVFALIDYINFTREGGRFSRKNEKEPMAYAFEDSIPDDIAKSLRVGDAIMCSSFNWWVSWAIMYLTSSQISHCAIYVGDGEIIHMRLSGFSKEPLRSLFGKKQRFIIGRFRVPEGFSKGFPLQKYSSILYSKRMLFYKFFNIISGRDWVYFRWRFFIDILVLSLLLDLPLVYLFKFHVFSLTCVFLFCLIIFNGIRHKFDPLPRFEVDTGKPCDLLYLIVKSLGIVILDQERLAVDKDSK